MKVSTFFIADERLSSGAELEIIPGRVAKLQKKLATPAVPQEKPIIFVRHRNVLLLRADFGPVFTGYYLHLMDKVQGAAHFDLSEDRARKIMGKVAAQLPGYLVPRLVRDEVGADAKTGIGFLY